MGGRDAVGRETGRIIFVKIWGLTGQMAKQRKEPPNDDLVLCPEYFILKKKKSHGDLSEDCEGLSKAYLIICLKCLKLLSRRVPCLRLMLFPRKG